MCVLVTKYKPSKTLSCNAMAQNNRPIPEIRISCDSVMEFPDLVENARGVSRAQERELREGSKERDLRPPGSPLPSRCSSKLKMIIERQISLGQSAQEVRLRVKYDVSDLIIVFRIPRVGDPV